MEDTTIEEIIYPEIAFIDKGNVIEVFTRVRKSHKGKYYFLDYKNGAEYVSEGDKEMQKQKLLTNLHFEVYIILFVGEIDSKKTHSLYDDMPQYEADKNKQSEKDRLVEKYKLYKFAKNDSVNPK